jgi:hypothetical protein
MRIEFSRKSGAVLAAISAGVLAIGAALPAQASTTTGWRQVYSAHYGVANNYSAYGTIVATSKNNAWALGGSDESYGNGTTQQAEAVHWNGSDWSKVTLPTAKDFIVAASAPAANDIWAVTHQGGYILHYNGSKWTVAHQLPNGPTELTDVVALSSTNVWVFGGSGEEAGYGTWHFNGSKWTREGGNVLGASFASAVSASNIWAVGSSGDAPENQILHYTGSTWQKVSSSAFSGLEGFNSITSLSASSVWLTAWGGNSGFNSYLLHYNGHVFSKVKVPWSMNTGRVVSDGAGGIWFSGLSSTGQDYAVHVTAKGAMSRTEVSHIGSLTTVPGTTALWSAGTADNKTAGSQAVILAYGKV